MPSLSPLRISGFVPLNHKGGVHVPAAAMALGRHIAPAKSRKYPLAIALEPANANHFKFVQFLPM
jgi:hypothetical protein